MTPKQIDVFHALMSSGSTVGASVILGLSQSAISRQLSSLETDLGFNLFHRDRGRLIATAEAQVLLQEVGELGDVLARLKRRTDELASGRFGRTLLKMGFPHSMTTTILPSVVREFLADGASASLELVAGPYDYVERAVTGRIADFGFVRLPAEDMGFEVMPLFSSAMLCAVPKGHPFADKKTIDASDLGQSEMVMLGRLRNTRKEIEEFFRSAKSAIRCSVETHSVESSIAMVSEGLGIAIVPAFLASFNTSQQVSFVPLSPEARVEYGIITLRDSPLSLPMERFIELLQKKILAESTFTSPI